MKIKALPSTLTIAIYVIPTLAATGVVGFIVYAEQLKSRLDYELFKFLFQFLLIIVIGGLITFLYTSYTKEKEQGLKDEDARKLKKTQTINLQHTFHNEFIASYNSVKLIRRLLRARARIYSTKDKAKDKYLLDTREYDRHLQDLTKLQLKFEFFIDEVESNPNLFTEKSVNIKLKAQLTLIAEYLNEIVTEYENCFKTYGDKYFLNEVPALSLDHLEKLSEFMITYPLAFRFKTGFKEPGNEVQRTVLMILHLK